MGNVQVLLSTYNGERYIEEQIESILRQTYEPVQILIRDDGSIDGTPQILKKYQGNKNINVLIEGNIGVIPSFFNLLQSSSDDADYFSFCDQDDYWNKEKLASAVEVLKNTPSDIPALYCGRVEIVDQDLTHIGMYPLRKKAPSFENAIVQNIATGCTIVINKAARNLLLRYTPDFGKVIMHDWWFYLVIAAFGRVVYDPNSYMLYRQHSANTMGTGHGKVDRWIARINRYLKNNEHQFITKQASEFLEMFEDLLEPDKKIVIERFLKSRGDFLGRLKYALFPDVYRQSLSEDIVCRIGLFLNLI